jgi:hypothetical protein
VTDVQSVREYVQPGIDNSPITDTVYSMTPAGRPEVGKPINVRLGDDLLRQVDAYAATAGIKRAEAVRQLIQRGLRRARR